MGRAREGRKSGCRSLRPGMAVRGGRQLQNARRPGTALSEGHAQAQPRLILAQEGLRRDLAQLQLHLCRPGTRLLLASQGCSNLRWPNVGAQPVAIVVDRGFEFHWLDMRSVGKRAAHWDLRQFPVVGRLGLQDMVLASRGQRQLCIVLQVRHGVLACLVLHGVAAVQVLVQKTLHAREDSHAILRGPVRRAGHETPDGRVRLLQVEAPVEL
mmetsp:Transcript_81742/g.257817  ORF Transcript_81742/g.257817 Transcript_81742/m.257817 type:complete len:212 (+) Transcript_81742:2-637(+)